MDFFKNLGFDPVMLAAQIINFLIIFYLLKRFLYKPVMDMMKKREDVIKEGLKQAEDARIALEEATEKEKKVLSKASEDAKKIVEDAKQQSLEIAKEVEENTKKQAEKMLLEAKAQIEQESKNAEGKLAQKISIVASDLLTKALEGIFSEKDQKQILDKTLKNIKKLN